MKPPLTLLAVRTPLSRVVRQVPRRTLASVSPSSREVFVPKLQASFPHRWLRDSCQCSACVHPSNRQKLHRTSDIPPDVRPEVTELSEGELRITWGQSASSEAPHKSVYSLDWLKHYTSAENTKSFHQDLGRITWNASQLHNAPNLIIDYSQLNDPPILLRAISQLTQYGIVFIRNMPNTPTDDEGCEVRKLATTLGRIRSTLYGDIWNVTNIRNSVNIAYTNLYLGLHMDLLYFEHPPRYQILHSVRNRVRGGGSIFVDAIHSAQRLRTISPSAFDVLSQVEVPFHYINNGHHLHHSHPTIELSRTDTAAIDYINYSPPFQAPLRIDTPPEFYDAQKLFANLLEEDQYEYMLQEGDAVIFDNRRVLHARKAFSEMGDTPEGETSRWLKGCYFEEDDILDRGRIIKERAEKV